MPRLPVIFILVTLCVDAMGIGLILPVMPELIQEVTGGNLARAAVWGGIMSSAFAVMQFAFSPLVGSLSDRFGRRPVLITSLAVMTLDYLVMALAGSIWLLLAGRVVGGITAATQSTASAFIADISPSERKAANFGLVGAAFGLGFVIGPVIGGLLGELGTRAPFLAAAALAGANMIFGALVLPETVTDRTRRPFSWRRSNPLGAFRALGRLPGLSRLLAVFFLYEFAFMVYPAVWVYFTRARFGWESGMVGVSLAAFGLSMAAVQGGLIQLILPRLGERDTVRLGIGFSVAAFVFVALVTNGWLALALTPATALGILATPALQALMSRSVGADRQGELQGVLSSARSVAMILSPLAMTRIFYAFTDAGSPWQLPGAPFLLALLLMLAAYLVFRRYPEGDPETRAAPAERPKDPGGLA